MSLKLSKSGGFSVQFAVIVLFFAAIAAVSCGKSPAAGLKSTSILGPGAGFVQSDFKSGPEALGFVIEEFAESYPDPSQSGRLVLSFLGKDEKGNLQVAIDAVDAVNYKCALLHLHYDNTKFSPASVHQGGFLPGAIFLGVTSLPDFVPVGAVLPNPQERDGVSGTGRIAVVTFEEKPFTMPRNASAAPMNVENRINFVSVLDDAVNKRVTIIFTEKNAGDYDLSTDVAVADVTPVAIRYLQIPTTMDPAIDPVAVVDGDSSGEVGISDVTPIALNYLNEVSAYAVKWGYFDESGGSNVIVGDLPNLTDAGAPYSISRDYSGDGLRPRYTYTFDYGASAEFGGDNAENLRFWIRPYGGGEYGIEGGPFSTQGGPSGDTAPPVWQTGFGIISSAYNNDNTEINITFGVATDADTPPVKYAAYWQTGTELYYPGARADNRFVILDVTGQTESPLTATLTAADGLPIGEVISIGVHARDSAFPFNETAALSPHPFNPGGLDWIVTSPGGGGDDTAPVWQTTQGISEAKPGNTTVTVGWGNAFHPEGAVTYEIYWLEGDYKSGATGDPPSFFATANHETATGSFQHTITGLTNGTEYSFGVRVRSPRGTFDTNTKVLTATPMDSVFPFAVPTDGKKYPGVTSTDSDIALTPIDNAPVIVYSEGYALNLSVCYFDGLDWIHETIASGAYFDHPSIEITGNVILVSAFNRATKAIELYSGDTLAQDWQKTTVDTISRDTSPIHECLASNMEYDPDSDTLGIVYHAGLDANRGVLKYAFRVADGPWTTEIIQNSPGTTNTPGACFVFTPDGKPSVAYTYGFFNWWQQQWDTLAHYAIRENEEWVIEKIPGDWLATQPIFLTYNTGTDQPFIAIGRDRWYEVYPGYSIPIIDGVSAWKDAFGNWQSDVVEQGEAFFSVTPPSIYVKFAGVDPAIGFSKAGQGFIFCTTIEIQDLEDNPPLYSQLTKFTFNGSTRSDFERLDPARQGCSALNMAIDVTEPRIVYQEVGILFQEDVEILNDFPAGDLVYWQF